jgi:hypothetical protein
MARSLPPGHRATIEVLPGMVLQIGQTTYRSNSNETVPVLSKWEWQVPSLEECRQRGVSVPQWQRSDLLVVRHLLTSAQLRSTSEAQPARRVAPDYFEQAVAQSRNCGEGSPERCLQSALLQPFVQGLYLDVREMLPRTPGHDAAKADGTADQVDGATGLGKWLNKLFGTRSADFDLSAADPRCSRFDSEYEAAASRAPCNFSFATLGWESLAHPLPGELLGGYSRMDIIKTGDPLMTMRPQRYELPLDPAAGVLPACSDTPQGTRCTLDMPMVQGFSDVQLLIPVQRKKFNVLGSEQILHVPVGMTLEAFEQKYGRVRQVLRAQEWFPPSVQLAGGKTRPRGNLADKHGRITLHVPRKEKAQASGGLIVSPSMRDDVLIAPGDILVLNPR